MVERSGTLRIYTFTMPKYLSGFIRKCLSLSRSKDSPPKTKTASARKRKKSNG